MRLSFSFLHYLFVFLVFSSLGIELYSQMPIECSIDYEPEGEITPVVNTEFCELINFEEEDYRSLAEFTVYVNFHFIEDELGNNFHCDPNGDPDLYAPAIVEEILKFSNNYFEDPQLNQLSTNPGKVYDARIRFELYTNPSNSGDLCGGIFFHPRNANTTIIEPSEALYGNQVLNVTIRDDNGLYNSTDPSDATVGGSTGGVGSDYIRLRNLLWYHKNGFYHPWNYGRTLNHELGHILNLPHSFSCHNDCYDMDNTLACGGPDGCTVSNITNTTCNPGPPPYCNESWGGAPDCCFCSWGNGNNFMGYNGDPRGMTPCQWETMFNYILSREDWTYASFCTKEEPILRITSGEQIQWDKLKLLNRDVVIESGASLEITCEVRMGEDHRFVVHRGGKLIIDEGKITNLCPDTRWAGIAVHGNAAKEQPDPFGTQAADDAGILIIQNGSIIEHAADAILTTAPGWPWPDFEQYFGGVVYAESSEFIDNGRVAGFMRYDFENKSQFIDCLMKKTPESFGNAIGVTIWECDGINFEQNSFENLDRSAIYGIDYGATIVNNNQFINCERGVEVLSTYPFSSWLDIWGNYFSDNSVHILANSPKNRTGLRIYNNDFQKSDFGIWIEGSSRFFMRNNSFLDELWGAVSWQTGTFSNLIDNNSFEDTYHGIDIRGKNSFLRFTRNCWENTTNDVNIFSLVNGTLGEVRSTQGGIFIPAGNCFASINNTDIYAPPSETVAFEYLIPNVLPTSCYIPADNLSDGGSNNYTIGYSSSFQNACSENFDEDEETIKDSLISAYLEMQNSYQALQNNPGVVSYQRSYDDSKAKYDYREAMMFGQWLKDRNFTEVEAILSLDQSKEGQRNLIGLKMVQKDFANADSLLALYPGTTAEDLQFKAIQEINIQRLQGGTNFALTTTQAADLKAIGDDQDTPIRGYAEALLSYLSGDPFEFSLSVGQGSRPFVNEANNHLDHAPYQLFPNPSSGAFTLLYPATISGQITLMGRIINVEGRVVYQFDLDGSGRQSLNVSSLIDGVYILQISDEHNPIFQRRLAIIH